MSLPFDPYLSQKILQLLDDKKEHTDVQCQNSDKTSQNYKTFKDFYDVIISIWDQKSIVDVMKDVLELQMYNNLCVDRQCFHYQKHGWYVLPEFERSNLRLSCRNYVHVHRSISNVFKCTCDAYPMSGKCLHINLVKMKIAETEIDIDVDSINIEDGDRSVIVVESFDNFLSESDISGSGSGSKSSGSGAIVFSVVIDSLSDPTIVTSSMQKYGKKKMKKRMLRCHLRCCSKYKSKCQHCDIVKDFYLTNFGPEDAEEDSEEDSEEEDVPVAPIELLPKNHQPYSTASIPVPDFCFKVEGEETTYATYQDYLYRFPINTTLYPRICSNDVDGKKCGEVLHVQDCQVKDIWNCSMYYEEKAVPVCVASKVICRKCNYINRYDGCEDRVFVYSKNILFSHHLMNEYTSRYTASANSFRAFCNTISRKYAAVKCHQCFSGRQCNQHLPFVDHKTFIKAWTSFVRLQPFNQKFSCPWCGPNPEEIIVDGLSLSLPLDKCGQLQPPTWVNNSNNDDLVNVPNNIGNQLRFIQNRQIRSLLFKFTGQVFHRQPETKPITEEEYQTLIKLLDRIPSLSGLKKTVQLIKSYDSLLAMKSANDTLITNRKLCIRLVRILSSDEPLQQFISNPLLLMKLFTNVKEQWPLLREQLRRSCPFLTVLLGAFAKTENGCPHQIVELMKQACDRAIEIEINFTSQRKTPPVVADLPQKDPHLGCWYGAKQIRNRPCYTRDHCKEEMKGKCDKKFESFQNMTGGAMIFWCKHRICVGMHIIKKSEGRNDVFSGILTHWETAPKVICYDYACQLMEYCITREPEYFKNTRFVVDRLHIKNHQKCSECFDMHEYQKSGASEFFHFHDSAAETGNAILGKIRCSCRYMSSDLYMIYVPLFLEIQNRTRIKVINKKMKEQGPGIECKFK